MSIFTKIQDGTGSKKLAKVTAKGQLVVGPIDFSEAFNATLGTAAAAVNVVPPLHGFNFIITSILLYANRNVGVNDATVTIFESSVGPTSSVPTKVIFTSEVPKQTSRDVQPLNLQVTESRWVNAVTDDDDVFVTIMGYYIET